MSSAGPRTSTTPPPRRMSERPPRRASGRTRAGVPRPPARPADRMEPGTVFAYGAARQPRGHGVLAPPRPAPDELQRHRRRTQARLGCLLEPQQQRGDYWDLPEVQGTSPPTTGVLPAYGHGRAEGRVGLPGGADSSDPNGLVDLRPDRPGRRGPVPRALPSGPGNRPDGRFTEWRQLDNLVGQAANRGVTILPILINMPNEAVTPPRTGAARKTFGGLRRGRGAPLWAERLVLVRMPLHPEADQGLGGRAEPNESQFWGPPSPSQYASLLKSVKPKLPGRRPVGAHSARRPLLRPGLLP